MKKRGPCGPFFIDRRGCVDEPTRVRPAGTGCPRRTVPRSGTGPERERGMRRRRTIPPSPPVNRKRPHWGLLPLTSKGAGWVHRVRPADTDWSRRGRLTLHYPHLTMPGAVRSSPNERGTFSNIPSVTMVARVGSSATISREFRQARKGATVAVTSGAGGVLARAAAPTTHWARGNAGPA
jgi:hypothetical protein